MIAKRRLHRPNTRCIAEQIRLVEQQQVVRVAVITVINEPADACLSVQLGQLIRVIDVRRVLVGN